MSSDDMARCPYNPSHVILKSRMAIHLIKCRQQHPFTLLSKCPFNTTHEVPKKELKYHMEVCDSRSNAESQIYVIGEPEPEFVPPKIDLPEPPENWDEEATTGSYLDVKNEILEKKLIFRQPVGMTKAERKAFFSEEVKRFRALSDAKAKGESESSSKENLPQALHNPKYASSDKQILNFKNEDSQLEEFDSFASTFLEPKTAKEKSLEKKFQVIKKKTAGRGFKME